MVKHRMYHVLREAGECVCVEIPEYVGGTIAEVLGGPSAGARRTAELSVTSRLVAASLVDWANDFEANDTKPRLPESGNCIRRDGGIWHLQFHAVH